MPFFNFFIRKPNQTIFYNQGSCHQPMKKRIDGNKLKRRIGIDNVQEFWNSFENKLINVIDEIVPLSTFNRGMVKTNIPKSIKNKINKRNRLLKSFKKSPSIVLKSRITYLNCVIRSHFFYKKKFEVRKGILPGNSKSLWNPATMA